MSIRSRIIVLIGLLLAAQAPVSATPPQVCQDAPLEELVAGTLAASAEPVEALAPRVLAEIDAIAGKLDSADSSYRRARRLHRLIQKRYLLHYDAEADGIATILLDGRYNCLSATMLYGLAARAAGLDARVLEIPGHLLLRLRLPGRVVDVETTERRGFDLARRGWSPSTGTILAGAASASRPSDLPPLLHQARGGPRYRELSLEETVGYVWLNTAWRALESGESVRAARCAMRARAHLPELGDDDGLRRLLARAFRDEYEHGRFEDAYRIATIDVTLFPGLTTSRDRMLASAVKLIELECDRDRPAEAEEILDDVAAATGDPLGLSHLERRATPVIAAAAVRLGDWALARRAAERYAGVEPDPVEAARLRRWVEERSPRDPLSDDAAFCPWPLATLSALTDSR
jgi:hypothetical protein